MPDGLPEVPETMLESIGDAVEGVTPAAAPIETTNQAVEETTATPEGSTTEEAATEAPDSFTKLDPNNIPDELQPWYKSLQADYTRKQQEAAPWRKLGEELGVSSPEDVRQAAELYSYLQDENNARVFAQRLAEAYGITGQAAPATEAAQPQTTDEFANLDDPAVAQLRAELTSIREDLAKRDAEQQREALQWSLLGEMNRQEALVKDQHPEWDAEGDEWKAVWNIAPTFNGDVIQAAQIVEAVQNAGLTRMLNGKATAAATEGLTPAAPARVGETVTSLDTSDPELRQQTAAAIEFVRGVVNQSE